MNSKRNMLNKLGYFFAFLSLGVILNLQTVAADPVTGVAIEQAIASNGATLASIRRILEEIKKDIENIAIYYGFDFTKKAPSGRTPDLNTLRAVTDASASNRERDTTLSDTNFFNPLFDKGPSASSGTDQIIQNLLNIVPDCKTPNCPSPEKIAQSYATALGLSNPYTTQREDLPNPNNSILNVNSLLGPLVYSAQTQQGGTSSADYTGSGSTLSPQQKAVNFIRFISGQADPLIIYNRIQYYNQLANSKNPGAQYIYLNQLRQYAAAVAMGASNLYQLYAERLPNPTTGKSPLQTLSEMATRRLKRPQNGESWINQMESASPLTLQREQLYLLAEINYQLYLNHLLQERMLATASVTEMLQTHSLKVQATAQTD